MESQAFAKDVYYCSLEYGPHDVRTSLVYYNLAKAFQSDKQTQQSLACNEQVISIWNAALQKLLLGIGNEKQHREDLPVVRVEIITLSTAIYQGFECELINVQGKSEMMEVLDMLSDICLIRQEVLGLHLL